eukprot:m.84410 g.84410  ORF g.84410 m.84410 type:complete len:150 (+) comp21191_c0_seq1:802-1251(+)
MLFCPPLLCRFRCPNLLTCVFVCMYMCVFALTTPPLFPTCVQVEGHTMAEMYEKADGNVWDKLCQRSGLTTEALLSLDDVYARWKSSRFSLAHPRCHHVDCDDDECDPTQEDLCKFLLAQQSKKRDVEKAIAVVHATASLCGAQFLLES